MALGKHIGRFTFLALLVAALLILGWRGTARGTAPPIIEFTGSESYQSDNPTLRFAILNLWGVSVLGFDWSDNIDERFAALAERLSTNAPKLDVVLLQEAWKDKARRALLAHDGVMRNFPYRVDISEQPGGAGLVIMSRLPIEMAYFHRFKAQGQCLKIWEGDCIAGKGVLAVRLKIGHRSVWVGNTHLIACYLRRDEPRTVCNKQDPNGNYRWSQIIEARRVIEDLAGNDSAIFGGDFNFTRTSRYYPAMTSPAIPTDSPYTSPLLPATDSGRGWEEFRETALDPSRRDYFWTRRGSEFRWHAQESVQPIFTSPAALSSGESVPLSDHPALMATLCLVSVSDPDNRCLSFN